MTGVGSDEPRGFGEYEIVRHLGRGGMAETYEAVRVGQGHMRFRVAVKRILPEHLGHEERARAQYLQRFEREARIGTKLQHPNIVRVIDYGKAEGAPYLVLELVEGVSLSKLLRILSYARQHLLGDLLVYLATELCAGLSYAHARGSVHRDVTPGNVLISRAGEVKLGDFGIADVAEEEARFTRTDAFVGKWTYVAPEVLQGKRADAQSDLYSLGVTLMEAATLEPLLSCRSPSEALDVRRSAKPDEVLARLRPDVDDGFRDALLPLLAFEREGRYRSAAEALEAFESVAQDGAAELDLQALLRTLPTGPQVPESAGDAGAFASGMTKEVMDRHQGLVRQVVRDVLSKLPHRPDGVFEELVAEGTMALLESYRRYDPRDSSGASFATFAYRRVQGQVLDALSGLQGIDQREYRRAKRLAARARRRESKGSEDGRLDWNRAALFETEQWLHRAFKEAELFQKEPFTDVARKVERAFLVERIEQLPSARQRQVLRLLFVDGMTQQEVADKIGIDKSGVTRHRDAGLKALRALLDRSNPPEG